MNNQQQSPNYTNNPNVLSVQVASHDSSEDGAQIISSARQPDEPSFAAGAGAATATGGGNESSSSSSTDQSQHQLNGGGGGRRSPKTISGHHDPVQRNIYVGLFAFSVLNALVGLALLLVWMLYYRPVPGIGLADRHQLGNLHPILMYTFMVSLNMYAVLIYRTHFNRDKSGLKWSHALLSGANIVMSLLGVAAMYKSHLLGQQANFYSLHSWIGSITNVFYLTQFIFGFIAFLKPGLKQQQRSRLMPWHRLAGRLILVLAAGAAITGILEMVIFQDKEGAYSKFTPITFIANFAGVSIILMTATSVYLLTAPQYMRPAA